jgi:ABC-type multidrug transport system fused ATPase/permease subunit
MSATNNNYSSQDFHYTQNGNVIWFHTKVFRFHASNDFLSLVGSAEEVKAYLVGASSVSIIVLSSFLVWVLMTWILHLHPQRVGFLSGAHMTLPSSSRLSRVVRTIFTLVLGVFILSLMIMLSSAFPKVNKAADTIYSGINAIDALVAEELTILDQMQAIGKTIIPLKMILASNLTNYCPSSDDLSSLFGEESNYTSVQRAIDDFENILDDELPYYKQLLSSLHAILSKAKQARPIFFKLSFSILYCTPLMLLSAAFVLGIIRAWKSISPLPFQTAQKNVLLPLFSLWTAISCVFICLVFIYSILNAGRYQTLFVCFIFYINHLSNFQHVASFLSI